MTREEKVETLKVFAGLTKEQKSIFVIGVLLSEHKEKYGAQILTDEQKSIFAIGVLMGQHKAKFGAQEQAEAQTA